MSKRFSLRHGMPLLFACLALGAIGYGTANAARGGQRSYERALLAFADAERALSEAVFRLQIGTVQHFDELKDAVRALRGAEAGLGAVPRHMVTAISFNEGRVQLSVQVNERLAHVEAFKTALASLQVSLDNLPELLARAEAEGLTAGGEIPALLARVTANLARLAHTPSGAVDEQLAAELTALASAAGEETSSTFNPGLAALARQGEVIRARKTALDNILKQILTVPLSARTVDLAHRYHAADGRFQRQSAYAIGGVTALLLLGLIATFTAMLRHANRRIAEAEARADDAREALKEFRNQSASFQRGEKEQSALLAEERHNALVRHAFELMAVLSRQENYIHVSPASEAFFGLTEKEMIGKSVYEGVHADDIIKLQDYLARAQRELQTDQTIQYRVMDAYGKWHVVETFASNQASNPAVRGMVLNTRRIGAAPVAGTR